MAEIWKILVCSNILWYNNALDSGVSKSTLFDTKILRHYTKELYANNQCHLHTVPNIL